MFRSAILTLMFAGLIAPGYIGVTGAQSLRDPAPTAVTLGVPGTVMLNPADVEKINGFGDRRSTKAKARAKADATKLARAMNLPCEPADAEQVGSGELKQDGKTIKLILYEISCTNGVGYFVESRGPQSPVAISCFAADATHTADIERNVKSDFYCQLPANKDIRAMAAALLNAAGTPCNVNNVRWFGVSDSGQAEYSEVACDNYKGYLLKTPRVGAAARTVVMSCQEAAQLGLKCRLTDGGSVSAPVRQQAFLDALKQNGVKCEPSRLRVIGRESVDKRYVVEFDCPQQPNGLVAFIPLDGNTNKFETLDCAAAGAQDIACKFVAR